MLGTVVGGHRLVAKLGEGGMGVVYEAEDAMLGRKTAVKMLRSGLSRNHAVVQRFFNEARAAARLRHPGIVEIHAFGYHDDGSAYLVMEHLEGESLQTRLGRVGKLDPEVAVRITRQVCSALSVAHDADIVHRDLKPDNIFVIADPDIEGGERIKLLDFGIAKLASGGGPAMTRTGAVMGTPSYMAPEQCRGTSIDCRADLYAVGCVLFRMLCERVPFPGELSGDVIAAQIRDAPPRPRDLDPEIDPWLESIVLKLLEKEPERRFASARELRDALERQTASQVSAPSNATLRGHLGGPGSSSGSGSFPRTEIAPRKRSKTLQATPAPTAPPASEPTLAPVEPTPAPVDPTSAPLEPLPEQTAPPGSPTTLEVSTGEARSPNKPPPRRWYRLAAAGTIALVAATAAALLWTYREREPEPGPPIDAYAVGEKLERGIGTAIDHAAAVAHYQHACTDGDRRGCGAWGRALIRGAGIARDRQAGFELVRTACDAGDMRACVEVASHANAIWRPGVAGEKRALLERACDAGEPRGCRDLAELVAGAEPDEARKRQAQAAAAFESECESRPESCYWLGWAIQADDGARAVAVWVDACNRGYGQACLDAAARYEDGWGVDKDPFHAERLYQQGADTLAGQCDIGDHGGCMDLAIRLERGEGLDKDHERAVELAQRVCDRGPIALCMRGLFIEREALGGQLCHRGVAEACMMLGFRRRRLNGSVVLADPGSLERYIELSERSCAVGDARACAGRARALSDKVLSEPARAERARARAVALYERACSRDARSCAAAAELWLLEIDGRTDATRAANFAERGCAGDSAYACWILAGAYARGRGVTADQNRARALYEKACDRDYASACEWLARQSTDSEAARRYSRKACKLDSSFCRNKSTP